MEHGDHLHLISVGNLEDGAHNHHTRPMQRLGAILAHLRATKRGRREFTEKGLTLCERHEGLSGPKMPSYPSITKNL
jgi:hypothetical protein